MSRFSELKEQLHSAIKDTKDKIQDSEIYQDLKGKYDELDVQTKLYINIGSLALLLLFILGSVLSGISKVNSLKREIDDREELIGYLQKSADTIKQYKSQNQDLNADSASPLDQWAEGIITMSRIDKSRVEIGQERTGTEDKESKEVLVDLKLSQINLRQLTRLLFQFTDQGKSRNLNVKDLNIDTKADPTGYLDASVTIATYRAK